MASQQECNRLFMAGEVALQRQQWKAAAEAFRTITEVEPSYPMAYLHLGYALLEDKKNAQALAAYRQALALCPQSLDAIFGIGIAFYHKHEYETALSLFHSIIECAPDHSAAYINLAACYERTGDNVQAIKTYQQAIAQVPFDLELYSGYTRLLLFHNGLERVIEEYETLATIEPGNPAPYFSLGLAFSQCQNWNRAVEYLERAAQLSTSNVYVLLPLAKSYYKNGKKEQAINTLRQYLTIQPKGREAYEAMAMVLEDMGRLEEAIECCRNLLCFDPSNVTERLRLSTMLFELEHRDQAKIELQIVLETKDDKVRGKVQEILKYYAAKDIC